MITQTNSENGMMPAALMMGSADEADEQQVKSLIAQTRELLARALMLEELARHQAAQDPLEDDPDIHKARCTSIDLRATAEKVMSEIRGSESGGQGGKHRMSSTRLAALTGQVQHCMIVGDREKAALLDTSTEKKKEDAKSVVKLIALPSIGLALSKMSAIVPSVAPIVHVSHALPEVPALSTLSLSPITWFERAGEKLREQGSHFFGKLSEVADEIAESKPIVAIREFAAKPMEHITRAGEAAVAATKHYATVAADKVTVAAKRTGTAIAEAADKYTPQVVKDGAKVVAKVADTYMVKPAKSLYEGAIDKASRAGEWVVGLFGAKTPDKVVAEALKPTPVLLVKAAPAPKPQTSNPAMAKALAAAASISLPVTSFFSQPIDGLMNFSTIGLPHLSQAVSPFMGLH